MAIVLISWGNYVSVNEVAITLFLAFIYLSFLRISLAFGIKWLYQPQKEEEKETKNQQLSL